MYQHISGFPELSPAEQILYNQVIHTIKKNFELIGAAPIETAIVERADLLLGKGDDKEIYALSRLQPEANNQQEKTLGLRFDLTLPLARYVTQHFNDLSFPFKRYQIQPVWRGERAQKGRYRQFTQCDIDVIGNESLPLLNDAEMPLIIYKIFKELDIGHFVLSVNNRKILTGYLSHFGIRDSETKAVIKIIDNIEKVDIQVTLEALSHFVQKQDDIQSLITFFQTKGRPEEVLAYLNALDVNDEFNRGRAELEALLGYLKCMGLPDAYYDIDLSIARGLDYYTGTVYETRLSGHEEIGSICSGGRYDHLLKQSLGARKALPGVGISIGISRLFSQLLEMKKFTPASSTPAHVMVTSLDTQGLEYYLTIAQALRAQNVNTLMYTGSSKIGKQIRLAANSGIAYAIIAGSNEIKENTLILKNLNTGAEDTRSISEAIAIISKTVEV